MRTCVGCRKRDSRSVLVRLVVNDGTVLTDERRSAAGRGAWVHPDPECLARAITGRTIGRALRAPEADVSELRNHEERHPNHHNERGENPMGIR